jgi:hypothetical protein
MNRREALVTALICASTQIAPASAAPPSPANTTCPDRRLTFSDLPVRCDFHSYDCRSGVTDAERQVADAERLLKAPHEPVNTPALAASLAQARATLATKRTAAQAVLAARDATRAPPTFQSGDDMLRELVIAADLIVVANIPRGAREDAGTVRLLRVLKGKLPDQKDALLTTLALAEDWDGLANGIFFLRAKGDGYALLQLTFDRQAPAHHAPAAPDAFLATPAPADTLRLIAAYAAAVLTEPPAVIIANHPTGQTALEQIDAAYGTAAQLFDGMTLAQAGDALHAASRHAPDPHGRVLAQAALVLLGDETELTALKDFAAEPDRDAETTEKIALYAVGSLRSPAGEATALAAQHSDDPPMRQAGTHALGVIGTPAAVRALGEVLGDTDQFVRNQALRGLCNLAPVCGPCGPDMKPRPPPQGAALVAAVALWRSKNLEPAARGG